MNLMILMQHVSPAEIGAETGGQKNPKSMRYMQSVSLVQSQSSFSCI